MLPASTAQDAGIRHILITGASGGLGCALAQAMADANVRLSLWGRDEERLHRTEELCRARGAATNCMRHDLRRLEETRTALLALDEASPIDMAFLNAGVSSGTLPGGGLEPVEDVCRILQVNATATLNTASWLISRMAERKRGHLVFISSIASLAPLPSSPAYCAAKSAVAIYARAMRLALRHSGVRISIVYPGYVDTPMSRRLKGPQPMRWSAEKAATYIRKRLEAGSDTIVFPKLLALGALALNFLPGLLSALRALPCSFSVEPDPESPAAPRVSTTGKASTNDD